MTWGWDGSTINATLGRGMYIYTLWYDIRLYTNMKWNKDPLFNHLLVPMDPGMKFTRNILEILQRQYG